MTFPDDAYKDGAIANRGIEQLERLKNSEEPFFLALGFYKPHDPFVAPKKYFEHYPINSITLYLDPPDATPLPSGDRSMKMGGSRAQ